MKRYLRRGTFLSMGKGGGSEGIVKFMKHPQQAAGFRVRSQYSILS